MSSGRGGVGNIRWNSLSPDERLHGPDNSSRSRLSLLSSSRNSCEQEREELINAEEEGVAPHSTGNKGLETITQYVSRDSPHPPNCDSKSLVHEGKIQKVLHVANPGSDEDEKLHRQKKGLLRGVLHQTGREHVANLPADNSLEHAPSTFVAGS
ncbi:hypothetical protein BDQ17DRAFT_1374452, partial [Cyathus striatus]